MTKMAKFVHKGDKIHSITIYFVSTNPKGVYNLENKVKLHKVMMYE